MSTVNLVGAIDAGTSSVRFTVCPSIYEEVQTGVHCFATVLSSFAAL
jgi:hypothetical protein